MTPREQILKTEELAAQTLSTDLKIPIEKAREMVQERIEKRRAHKERIYALLKSRNPDIVNLEDERRARIEQVAEESGVSQEAAAAVVIVGDLQIARAMRGLQQTGDIGDKDMRELLGVIGSTPQDILALLDEKAG